ncbi:hypothetical protein BU23DRAFT_551624 [Bimuria novae-zelandiae CBS 107.79]|uniref:Uncharacterized protein n=1 Tax=Bimuria novae-zelandiae CBS 107.79 TaxID=1447943 RepID=A0A6A5VP60_9PLEO|nr:hypothetical protein BU23DRAFT_551624 [Bimuria novae-zelandiae CBS 107.79]
MRPFKIPKHPHHCTPLYRIRTHALSATLVVGFLSGFATGTVYWNLPSTACIPNHAPMLRNVR